MPSTAKSKFSFGVSTLSISAIVCSSIFMAPTAIADTKVKTNLPPVLQVGNTESQAQKTDRFIVKFTDTAKTNPTERGNAYGKVAKQLGVTAKEVRETGTGATVVQADRKLTASEAKLMVEGLKAQPNVAYAEPDLLLQPTATPNDSYYPNQWNLFEEAAGLRLPTVWDKTTGAGQVVAVIDTGILPHADLNANVLPGYDMISNATMARDGGGRDSDPRDEGDWRVSGDCGSTATVNSSWHGLHVAGTVGAVANNGSGVSGAAYGAKVLPVRALGLCGGYMSDIADSIIWASGGTVSGVPANANPARIINLSLGGPSACSTTSQIAIDTAVSRGAAVFAAAGNNNHPAVNNTPANCNNVIVVGASGRQGNRASYSNYGATVDIMAPGGDPAGYILSTLNSGTTTPAGDSYANYQGTSMATPQAASVGALMLAANPSLTPAQIEAKLKETARPLQVSCPEGCGAGIVNPVSSVVAAPPAESGGITAGTPTITGVAKMDSTLTAEPGTWGPGTVTFTYQWNRSGTPIAGATGKTYTAKSDDTNKILTVTVTGSSTGYTPVSKTSAGTNAVEMGSLTGTYPTISGNTHAGSTLTANPGTWGPAPVAFEYQWYRSGVAVAGATASTYALTSSDVNSTMRVRVYGVKDGYHRGYLDSNSTATITSAPTSGTLSTATPTITGATQVGKTLTANAGTWGPAPVTLSYQWYRSGAAISGATASTYVLTSADQSHPIQVRVTGTKSGYTTATTSSANTAAITAAPTTTGTLTSSTPTISGTLKYGQTLTANPGTWGPAPVTLTYQWYRSGKPINGATSSTYKLALLDRYDTIRVRVTGYKSGYTTVYRDSLTTAKVQ